MVNAQPTTQNRGMDEYEELFKQAVHMAYDEVEAPTDEDVINWFRWLLCGTETVH